MKNNIQDWYFLDNDRIFLKYLNGKVVILGVHHHNQKEQTVLCDDFETYLKY